MCLCTFQQVRFMKREIDKELEEIMNEAEQYQKDRKEEMRTYIKNAIEHISLAVNDEDGQKYADACKEFFAILEEVRIWK